MTRHVLYPAGTPRFNHVAMSLPPEQLDETSRNDIVAFWSEVFGFEELPTMTVDRHRLVLSCVHWEQFIFLIADADGGVMQCPRLDHFGLSVKSLDDLEAAWERAKAYRRRDDRVDIIEPSFEDHEVVKIHSMYVGYLLPMMCELQYWEFA